MEADMRSASHVHLSGIFGWTILCVPFYWQFAAWRALRFRNTKQFFFFETLAWLLNDLFFRNVVAKPSSLRISPTRLHSQLQVLLLLLPARSIEPPSVLRGVYCALHVCTVPVLFIAVTTQLNNIVLVKLIVGVPSFFYGLSKVFLKLMCPWCPTITIQPERGVTPYDPNPY
jgi:hypothetical protein